MKIAIIVPCFPSLSETFIINHITGLIDKGHDVKIISLTQPVSVPSHNIIKKYDLIKKTKYIRKPPENKLFCRIHAGISISLSMMKYPRKLTRGLRWLLFIDRRKFYHKLFFLLSVLPLEYDIYHFHFAQTGQLGAFLKLSGFPVKMLTSFHGYDVNKLPLEKNENRYQDLFTCDSHFIANTNFTKQQAIQLGADASKISIIPVGLHTKDFPYRESVFKTTDHVTQVLTIGRLVEKKGYYYSISAMGRLINEGFNLHYTIVGNGPLRNQLEGLVQSLGISDNVSFVGEKPQQDIIDLYQRSDLFVLSSVTAADGDKEGQGLVLQEAQACGLPVVSTWHNGIPDGVLNNQSGLLVPEKDISALYEAIKTLLLNPARWGEMGKQGRVFTENNYDMSVISDQLIELYNSL